MKNDLPELQELREVVGRLVKKPASRKLIRILADYAEELDKYKANRAGRWQN